MENCSRVRIHEVEQHGDVVGVDAFFELAVDVVDVSIGVVVVDTIATLMFVGTMIFAASKIVKPRDI